ncbi:MAG: hypothetical protein HY730_04360 [Candidatus Tectomicrobia bacterium]|uniref:HEPN AbiU2-like domain-containing protein n=1 Tax=Tectimicrobiota bacterium TaxID=2528274 RepID=A0A933GN47_UNCTE|nr:hypothetical protein [Candidatus Tectomicrobia bacterium]
MRTILNTLRHEAESTIRAFYALQQFKYLFTNQESVNKINRNVHFWMIFERSLLTKVFIGIRRLFESKADTFNFQRALNMINNKIEDFQPLALKQRKLGGQKEPLGWIDEYMADVYTPCETDFNVLSKLVRLNSKQMKGLYTEAATKIFAHAIHTETTVINNLLSDTKFDEIENSLNAIWHFYEQVWQMYENGRKPLMQISAYPYKEEVQQSVIRQFGVGT